MPTYRSRTLSVTIARPWTEVYAYAADPRNMHHWAAGLGQDFAPDGDGWAFHDPGGHRIRLAFTLANISASSTTTSSRPPASSTFPPASCPTAMERR